MDLNLQDLFKIDQKNAVPEQGKILMSEPLLTDSIFSRSVVLLVSEDKDNHVGFILNKPADIEIHEIVKDFPIIDSNVSFGGPVQTDAVYYIHTVGELIPGSIKIKEGLYWGGDFNRLKMLIEENVIKSYQIRFFIGYAGWDKGQLKGEIQQNNWLISDIVQNDAMISDEKLWTKMLFKLGGKYKLWNNFPQSPDLN